MQEYFANMDLSMFNLCSEAERSGNLDTSGFSQKKDFITSKKYLQYLIYIHLGIIVNICSIAYTISAMLCTEHTPDLPHYITSSTSVPQSCYSALAT